MRRTPEHPNFLHHPSWGCRGQRPQRRWQGRPRTVGKVSPSVPCRTCVPGPRRARTHPGVELAVRHVPADGAGAPDTSRDAGSGLRSEARLLARPRALRAPPVQSPRTGPSSSALVPRVDRPAGADARSLRPARPLLPGRWQLWCCVREWREGGEKARRAPGSGTERRRGHATREGGNCGGGGRNPRLTRASPAPHHGRPPPPLSPQRPRCHRVLGRGAGPARSGAPGGGTRRPLLAAARTPHRCGRAVAPAAPRHPNHLGRGWAKVRRSREEREEKCG